MFLSSGKHLSRAFFLGVFFCFSLGVSAQNIISEPLAADFDAQLKDPAGGKEIHPEKIRSVDSSDLTDLRKLFDKDAFQKKIETEHVRIDKKNRFGEFNKPETNDFAPDLRSKEAREKQFAFTETKEFPLHSARRISSAPPGKPENEIALEEGFRWRAAIQQSLIFLAVQHGYALTQPKTREALKGNFFKDYAASVKALRGWDDGGRFFTNYVAHPMQGSMTGFIYVQNDPKALRQQFGKSGDYWRSRLKAMAWTALWSTQFEIGPVSQASIGNVGLSGKQTWEDIVVTPTLGTAWLIAEDAADRFITQRIEQATDNFYVKVFSRMLLSPTRIFANMLRFKVPWYRDRDHILK